MPGHLPYVPADDPIAGAIRAAAGALLIAAAAGFVLLLAIAWV